MNIEDINSVSSANLFVETHVAVLRAQESGECAWDGQPPPEFRNVVSLRISDALAFEPLPPLTLHTVELLDCASGVQLGTATWMPDEDGCSCLRLHSFEKKYVLPLPTVPRLQARVTAHTPHDCARARQAMLLVIEVRVLNARPPAYFNTGTINPHYTPDYLSYIVRTEQEAQARDADAASSSSASDDPGDEIEQFFEQHLRV